MINSSGNYLSREYIFQIIMPTLINNIPFVWASSDDEEFLAASGISNPAFNSQEKITHCQLKQEAEEVPVGGSIALQDQINRDFAAPTTAIKFQLFPNLPEPTAKPAAQVLVSVKPQQTVAPEASDGCKEPPPSSSAVTHSFKFRHRNVKQPVGQPELDFLEPPQDLSSDSDLDPPFKPSLTEDEDEDYESDTSPLKKKAKRGKSSGKKVKKLKRSSKDKKWVEGKGKNVEDESQFGDKINQEKMLDVNHDVNDLIELESSGLEVNQENAIDIGPTGDVSLLHVRDDIHELVDRTGIPLKYGTKEYMEKYAELNKIVLETEKGYTREGKRFLAYVKAKNGEVDEAALKNGSLPVADVALIVSRYMSERINGTKKKKTGENCRLDTTTLDKVWYGLRSFLRTKCGYNPKDQEFELACNAKGTSMRLSKQTAGLGEGAHRSEGWSKAMIIYLLYSDHLNDWSGTGLQYRFYVLTILYFMPRVRKEVLSLTRGSFRRIFWSNGDIRGMVYIPLGQTKCDRGNCPEKDAFGYFKR